MGKVNSYRDLIAWQRSYSLVLTVYDITRGFPPEEKFGLTQQIRRCAVSIPSNIAEGWGRESRPDYVRFLRTARGSAFELQTQLLLASDLGYMPRDHAAPSLIDEVARLTNSLIRALERKDA